MTLPADVSTDRDASSLSPLKQLTGTVIDDRYEVGELLGCGGMGAVYEAMQLELDRRVAIKILNPAYMHRGDYLARFMQEAKAASRIRHENVVQMLDFGKLPNGSVYSVMELLQGQDLSRLLKQELKLPWPRVRDLLLQLVRGVKAAHAQGIIHRDIKPANLFLTREAGDVREVLKVLDFGVARVQSNDGETAALTGTADLLGTPAYMAPELARGRRACPRTEVYSVGVVAYQMLTGRVPFRGDSPFDALFRAATEPTPPLTSLEPSVPSAVDALVLRMLAKDPHDRFPDMAALQRAIAGLDDYGRPHAEPSLVTGPTETIPASSSVVGAPTVPSVSLPQTSPTFGPAPRRWPAALLIGTGVLAATFAITIAVTRDDRRATSPPAEAITAAASPQPVAPPPAEPAPVEPTPITTASDVDVVIDDDSEPVAPAKPREPKASPPRAATPKPTPRAEEGPSDADVVGRVQRQARSRCKSLLGGAAVRVTFGIGPRGEVLTPRGDPRGAAADCVINVLGSSRFAPGSMRRGVLQL